MNRPVVGAALLAAAFTIALPAFAADAPAKPAKKPAATKKAEAKPAAPAAEEPAQALTEGQLAAAGRVMVGTASCEFNQQVSVAALDGKPGHFKVGFNKSSYVMVPEETTTGAVRLEDKKNGMVWVQIPAKSMLLNAKAGQRMVDGCQQKEQRAAL